MTSKTKAVPASSEYSLRHAELEPRLCVTGQGSWSAIWVGPVGSGLAWIGVLFVCQIPHSTYSILWVVQRPDRVRSAWVGQIHPGRVGSSNGSKHLTRFQLWSLEFKVVSMSRGMFDLTELGDHRASTIASETCTGNTSTMHNVVILNSVPSLVNITGAHKRHRITWSTAVNCQLKWKAGQACWAVEP